MTALDKPPYLVRQSPINFNGRVPVLLPVARNDAEQFLSAADAQAEIEAEHRRERRELDDLAFIFLLATNGNTAEAEKILDNFVDLLFPGGVMSLWRYRIMLAGIREGL